MEIFSMVFNLYLVSKIKMSLRTAIGGLSIFLFCKEFISINQIPFDYRNEEPLAPADYPKGTFLISLKYFQHVLNKYENPKRGDLVIAEQPDKTAKFKVVEAIPQTYFTEELGGITFYVPNGFIVLRDPETNSTKMEFIGNVLGCDHFPLKF